ncbi:ROK family protein [Allostreptomyces psammosilenae]|uniref:Glucokinase n=1 Tax=Allostreptomyces psammosilenae TaxID=1892865 RepID=A0A852ZZ29_9ACTN|nr:ROK family protein [Allostreptomyces psammosilenae]NYI07596.1 glucokinase [Allostreptomyces psammosilenae]
MPHVPDPAHAPGPARPAEDPRPVLAIDIGGTKIALALVDATATPRLRTRIPTPRVDDPEAAWAAVAHAARPLLDAAEAAEAAEAGGADGGSPGGPGGGVRGVGIGSAGPLDPVAGTISPVMIPAWRDFPIRSRAGALLPGRRLPVSLVGDGVCTAIGEHWAGAGQRVHNMLGCVVSTGVGGGLILGGRPRVGPTGNAGHVGHIVTEVDGPPCPCGSRGCLELFASGTAVVTLAHESGWRGPVADPAVGPTAGDVAAAARAGDPVARAVFTRAGRALGAAFTSVCAVCDLDRIVVGGGVAQAGAVLFDALEAGMREFGGLGFLRRVTVHPAALGQDAGLVGAAAPLLLPDRYGAADPGFSHPGPARIP